MLTTDNRPSEEGLRLNVVSVNVGDVPADTEDFPGVFDENTFRISGLAFDVVFAPAAELEGDYNGDGLVDAADFTVWRDNLGELVDLTNRGDGLSGPVSIDDYLV